MLFDIFKKKAASESKEKTNNLTPSEIKFMSKDYKAQGERAKQQMLEVSMLEGLPEATREMNRLEYIHWDSTERHFQLIHIIEEEYKRLNSESLLQDEKACEKIINLCKEDISLAPEMKECFIGTSPYLKKLPRYPSFKRLSIVYENLGDIKNAISILEYAIELGFDSDNTKSGIQGRLEKLRKKL